MKVYIFEHNGRWLSGYSVAVAHDELKARELLAPILESHDINAESLKLLRIMPLDSLGAALVWDGDY